ncbi:MAG: SLBB domain-containing protein [Chitinivibrionales bacterium]|nr:SLBB domain-containing protein [Chitinivibrionales bacterium]
MHPYRLLNYLRQPLLVLLLMLAVSELEAQNQPFSGASFPEMRQLNQSPAMKTVIDQTIDPSSYYIGTGDIIEVRSTKMPWARYTGTVNENNMLFIPEFGAVALGKQTWATAITTIHHYVLKKNSSLGEVNITLTDIKRVSVVVSGCIATAGTFSISGNLRILDVIKIANNNTIPDFTKTNLRSVIVRSRMDGDTASLDLLRFIVAGDLSANPYVYPGQSIQCMPVVQHALVNGEITGLAPREIPIRPLESIADVLALYTFTMEADSNYIVVQKTGRQPGVFSLTQCRGLSIEHLDCITICPKTPRNERHTISIRGEVQRPGLYTLNNTKTSASQAIVLAGGVTTQADLSRAYVIRRSMTDSVSLKNLGTNTENSRRQIVYGMVKLRESKDFSVVPLDKKQVILQDQDELFVPRIQESVYVSGNVKNPGVYPFVQSKEAGYFIDQAGGIARSGDKNNIRIVTLYGDAYKSREDKIIESGDIITVPEKPELPWTQQWTPILQLVASSLSITLALYSIYK